VLAGFKYDLTPQLYASAQLGVTFSDEKNSGSVFTYAPGLGYKFSENVDALLKYTGYSKDGNSLSTVGLRIAYTF
jgi:predicted porin